jgi:sugar lactone lactonase YvrE
MRMSDAEKGYVPPQATTRVAEGPRQAYFRPKIGSKFSPDAVNASQAIITNPYMDPARVFFAKPLALQCTADGGLIVGGRGGLDKESKALGTGYWRIAPDGAVTPLYTRSTNAYGKTEGTRCGAPYGKTRLEPENFALAPDGSLVKSVDYAVTRIERDGYVTRVAGAPLSCEENGNPSQVRGLVDGPADTARFNKVGPTTVDPQGNIWVADQSDCALRRITPDGQVTTVIAPDTACPSSTSILPEDRVGLSYLAWDAVHGELVGARSFSVAVPVHNWYVTVWRIKPTGEFRRVLFGKKGGVSPAKHQIDGIQSSLAVDPQGRIHFGCRLMTNSSVLLVLRVDEAGATVVPVTGGGFRPGDSPEFKPRDGAAGRAYFDHIDGMCFSPDGTLFLLDEHLVRKLDRSGQVSTWAF